MFFRKKKKVEVINEIEKFNTSLEASFKHVKSDVKNIHDWLKYLYYQNLNQQQTIDALQLRFEKIMNLRKELQEFTRGEIKVLIDKYYSLNPVYERLEQIENKIEKIFIIKHGSDLQTPKEAQIKSEFEGKVYRNFDFNQKNEYKPYFSSNSYLKDKILRKVARDSKDYVKNFIHSLIARYERISALNLREMVVEDQNLCSKSSFYRILAEIEKEEEVNILQEGKGKVFISNLAKNTNSKGLNTV